MPPTRTELLQGMPVFGAIRDDSLHFLLEVARVAVVRAGEPFFREGEPGSSMFVLEAGRAAVVKHWHGRDYVVNRLVAGDCFGEMALMDLHPRSASVHAEEDCRAIELDAADLHRLFKRDPEQFALMQMNVGREVCRRLRATDELLFRAIRGEALSQGESRFLGA
jgi:CRP/FNR family cyclic AMP-dependent transcriptional regulator